MGRAVFVICGSDVYFMALVLMLGILILSQIGRYCNDAVDRRRGSSINQ
jgi:hypothetical protein